MRLRAGNPAPLSLSPPFFRTEHAEFRGWIRFAGVCDSVSVGGSPGPRGPAGTSLPAGNRPAHLLPGAQAVPGKPVWLGRGNASSLVLKSPESVERGIYVFPNQRVGRYLLKRPHQGLKDTNMIRNQLRLFLWLNGSTWEMALLPRKTLWIRQKI